MVCSQLSIFSKANFEFTLRFHFCLGRRRVSSHRLGLLRKFGLFAQILEFLVQGHHFPIFSFPNPSHDLLSTTNITPSSEIHPPPTADPMLTDLITINFSNFVKLKNFQINFVSIEL